MGGGNGSGNAGTQAEPWSLAEFVDHFDTEEKAGAFNNDDRFYFEAGIYKPTKTLYIKKGIYLIGATTGERTVFSGDTNNSETANEGDRDHLFKVKQLSNPVHFQNIDFEYFYMNQPSTFDYDSATGVIIIASSETSNTINNCNFRNIKNSGNGGSAIITSHSKIIVNNSTFTDIVADSRGAVIRMGAGPQCITELNNCLIENCSITGSSVPGGMIIVQYGKSLTINNSVIRNNTSTNANGGAIWLGEHKTGSGDHLRNLTLNNCLIYGNTAVAGPAIFHNNTTSVTYTNCVADVPNNESNYVVPAINITSVGVGTYYIGAPFTMPIGVTGKTFSDISGTTLTVGKTYTAGNDVPAGTALLVEGSEGSYYPTITTSSEVAPNDNLLKGSDLNETTTGGTKYYKLANDTGLHGLGFYWGAANGAAFTNGAHKAYLALSGEPSARSFFSFFDNDVTAIDRIATTTLRKDGKFIENGRIVIMKNGVKYNTVGQKM